MIISIIHPSRGRPERSIQSIRNWVANAGVDVQVIVSVDQSDPKLPLYEEIYQEYMAFRSLDKFIIGEGNSAVDATNLGAKAADGDILMYVSEDLECFENWGGCLLEVVDGKEDWILKTQDGTQLWIITLPIMDRKYYNRFGYFYHPGYLHNFCDTEMTAVADMLQRKLTCDLLFYHKHYTVAKTHKDEVSIKADASWDQGQKLFLERYQKDFDLVNPPAKVEARHIGWIKRFGVAIK